MQSRLDEALTKNKLLRNLVGFSVNLVNIEKKWENFEVAISDFDTLLAEQTETIKKDLQKRESATQTEIEKFEQRWKTLRPKHTEELDKESARESALTMKELRQQWLQIEN